MKVGFVVAMEKEYEPFLSSLGELKETVVLCGIEFCTYFSGDNCVILAKCGIGEIAASSAVSLLIGAFGCDYILNFGLVGALTSSLSEKAIVAVDSVVHYDSDITAFGHPLGAAADMSSPFLLSDRKLLSVLSDKLPAVRLASGDKFIADNARRNQIITDFSADICDMEGAGIALTCVRSGVPFTMIKVVSDSADDGAEATYMKNKLGGLEFALDVVLGAIFELYNA